MTDSAEHKSGQESQFSKRSTTSSKNEPGPPGRWDIVCSFLPRALVLAALGYAFLHAGAIQPTRQHHVCLILLLAIVVSIISPAGSFNNQRYCHPRVLYLILGAWACWLCFTAMQSVPLPKGVVGWLSPSTMRLREQFAGTTQLADWQTLSLIPYKTRSAWSNYTIAMAFFLLGTSAWNTRKSKNIALIAIAVAGGLLSVWGLINRANGESDLLPGVPAPVGSLPFATIIYKNAGASIVIASIAAAIGLLLVTLRPALRLKSSRRSSRRRRVREHSRPRSQSETDGQSKQGSDSSRRSSNRSRSGSSSSRSSGQSGSGYSNGAYWTEPNVMAVLVLLGLLMLGLVASLSRGGWIATLLALAGWAFSMRKYVSLKAGLWIIGAALVVGIFGTYMGGVGGTVTERAEQLSLENISTNDRFTHWSDAIETTFDYPVFGAGLGTYGYAQLTNQDIDTPRWFSHAHNQPLEWLVECGFAAFTLMIVGAASVIWLLVQLFRLRKKGTTPLIWFSVGTIAFSAISLQSLVDFVVLTPAVLWVNALLIGIAANARPDKDGPPSEPVPPPQAYSSDQKEFVIPLSERVSTFVGNTLARPFAWMLFVAAMLLLSQTWLQNEILDSSALAKSHVPVTTKVPKTSRIRKARETLLARANAHPTNGRLWQRLAAWDIVQYRAELLESQKDDPQKLNWESTAPERLFQIYHSRSPDDQKETLENWITTESQRQAIADATAHYERSIQCNPLVPQVHLQIAFISPLTEQPYQQHAEFSQQLASSNGDLQFHNGYLAMCVGDVEAMIDQWRRCLQYTPENLPYVLKLSSSNLPSGKPVLTQTEITTEVMRDLRTNLWVALVRRSFREKQYEPFQKSFIAAATDAIRKDKVIPDDRRHYYLAQLADFRGDREAATQQYGEAVQADRSNPSYRFRYASALLERGRLAEAREEAAVGRALDEEKERWRILIGRIDRQLKASTVVPKREL